MSSFAQHAVVGRQPGRVPTGDVVSPLVRGIVTGAPLSLMLWAGILWGAARIL